MSSAPSTVLSNLGLVAPAAGLRELLAPAASASASETDALFLALLVFSAVCLALVLVALDVFLWRYRRRADGEVGRPTTPSSGQLVVLVAAPLFVAALLFGIGVRGYVDRVVAPTGATLIQAQGGETGWSFVYAGGFASDELHLPLEHPVRLTLTTRDRMLGLAVEELRLKQVALPDRITETWVQATRPGEYALGSHVYAGTAMDSLAAKVVVHEDGGFSQWLAESANVVDRLPPEEAGQVLVQRNGCLACHSIDGSPGTAPTLLGIFGREQSFTDGTSLVVDDAYLSESILQSQARVVAGFPPVMPDFSQKLDEREVGAILAYLKSLGAGPEEE